jgi:hypothetical protein
MDQAEFLKPLLLDVKEPTKNFAALRALDQVDISLRAGEIHALLGENGAGKSTLIKLITGVLARNAGMVLLGGRQIAPRTARAADLSARVLILDEPTASLDRHEVAMPSSTMRARAARGIIFVTHLLDQIHEATDMLSSVLAGLAGIVFSLCTAAGCSLAAIGVELDTIAAVVIGGTLLTGGQGSVIGTFIGVLIRGLIQTYINFDGTLSSWRTKIAAGVLLFAFIALQQGMVKLASRSRPRNAVVIGPSGVNPSVVSQGVVSP